MRRKREEGKEGDGNDHGNSYSKNLKGVLKDSTESDTCCQQGDCVVEAAATVFITREFQRSSQNSDSHEISRFSHIWNCSLDFCVKGRRLSLYYLLKQTG